MTECPKCHEEYCRLRFGWQLEDKSYICYDCAYSLDIEEWLAGRTK